MPDSRNNTQTEQRNVTLQDIADQCGVSIVTVSRALRQDRKNVGEETIARVMSVARELGYDPARNHNARRLALMKYGQRPLNQVIALFVPAGSTRVNYYSLIIEGIVEVLAPRRFATLTCYASESEPYAFPFIFGRGDVDAVITLAGQHVISPVLKQLREEPAWADHPIISVIEPIAGCYAISPDDRAGGRMAAAHLLELGHRHLLYFAKSDEEEYPHRQRLEGYRDACRVSNLDPVKILHAVPYSHHDPLGTAQALQETLRKHPEVTGILARNDSAVVNVILGALHNMGLCVPRDISIVGYDDAEVVRDSHGENCLTTMRVPLGDLGRMAAQTALSWLTTNTPPPDMVVSPVSLIMRGSTAPPPRR